MASATVMAAIAAIAIRRMSPPRCPCQAGRPVPLQSRALYATRRGPHLRAGPARLSAVGDIGLELASGSVVRPNTPVLLAYGALTSAQVCSNCYQNCYQARCRLQRYDLAQDA